ncbi:hypothetical protein MAR_032974 [Mya arenaria]|uniref:Uncharacterized protein n=1 Tax=Mya arenaria TaxID=6604 RepID=A0ABY7GAT0_MYAAR|nr:hypothetical protein MAR_032974 [Mya arenaria]
MLEQETGDETTELEQFEYVTVSSKGSQVRKKTDADKKDDKCERDVLGLHGRGTSLNTLQQIFTRMIVRSFMTSLRIIGKIAGNDELQSSYFQRTEVTIHVSILYRFALLGIDGVDSTEESPNIVTEQFIVFSKQNHEIQEMIHQYLTSISYPVDTMHEFTDDQGYIICSLGPQDAAGGYIKRQIDLAILRGNVVINTAKDVYQYACDNLEVTSNLLTSARRIFRFVETSQARMVY